MTSPHIAARQESAGDKGRTGIILASASPRRSDLLRQIGVEFETRAAETDETLQGPAPPEDCVSVLARRKASAAAALIGGDAHYRENYERAIIIGADTIVAARGGAILGKPKDGGDAKRMLKLLSGKWHCVYTGVALIEMQKISESEFVRRAECVKYEKTRVRMCDLDDETIDLYIKTGEPDGKAGAYAIQGAGAMLIERVEGCYSNIVGLPLRLLCKMLNDINYNPLKKK